MLTIMDGPKLKIFHFTYVRVQSTRLYWNLSCVWLSSTTFSECSDLSSMTDIFCTALYYTHSMLSLDKEQKIRNSGNPNYRLVQRKYAFHANWVFPQRVSSFVFVTRMEEKQKTDGTKYHKDSSFHRIALQEGFRHQIFKTHDKITKKTVCKFYFSFLWSVKWKKFLS